MRKALHISETEFFASLALPQGETRSSMRVISKAMASGRSSAFFFVSPDQRFLIKSMSKTEQRLMLRVLEAYTAHLAETTLSLLPRYVGLYSVKTPGQRTRRFVALANFFAGLYPISRRYDLKGCARSRCPHHPCDGQHHPRHHCATTKAEGRNKGCGHDDDHLQ